jgi:hypothetical protein
MQSSIYQYIAFVFCLMIDNVVGEA